MHIIMHIILHFKAPPWRRRADHKHAMVQCCYHRGRLRRRRLAAAAPRQRPRAGLRVRLCGAGGGRADDDRPAIQVPGRRRDRNGGLSPRAFRWRIDLRGRRCSLKVAVAIIIILIVIILIIIIIIIIATIIRPRYGQTGGREREVHTRAERGSRRGRAGRGRGRGGVWGVSGERVGRGVRERI